MELSYLGVAFWTNNVYLKHYFLEKNNSNCLPLSKYCQTIFCGVLAKSLKNEVLIIGYVIWYNSPSGSTDFFILIECFDSQLFEQNTESLFSLKILRIKHPNTDLLDLQIKWAAHFHTASYFAPKIKTSMLIAFLSFKKIFSFCEETFDFF